MTRKQFLKQEDEFISTSVKSIKWIKENYNKIIISGIIFFVVLIGVLSVRYRNRSNLIKSKNFLALAKRTYYGKVRSPSDDPNIPLGPDEFVSYEDKYKKAMDYFEQLKAIYPDSKVSEESDFFIANCLYFLGNYDQAIEGFNNYLDKYPNGIYPLQAKIALGDVQEAKGDFENAIKTYREILDYNQDFILLDAIYNKLGLCYEKINSFEKAKDAYQQIVINFPDSPFLEEAEEKIEFLEGKG